MTEFKGGRMSQVPYRLRGIALGLAAVVVLIVAFGPPSAMQVLRGLANWWTVGLVAASAGTLVWFVYWVYLRRWLRVRRIANIRLKRMLEDR
jgi:hypothetical protein